MLWFDLGRLAGRPRYGCSYQRPLGVHDGEGVLALLVDVPKGAAGLAAVQRGRMPVSRWHP